MLSTPTGLRARASWAQLRTPVHTLPPNSLFVGSQSELVSPVKTLRAGLTGVTEAQVVTTGTAERRSYSAAEGLQKKGAYPASMTRSTT